MTLITRDSDASPDTSTLVACPPLGPLTAGEALDALAPCYIKSSDGKVYMTNASTAGEAAEVAGFTMKAYGSGAPVTLYGVGVRAHYAASGLTPGAILYAGATAGRLDDAPTVGDQVGVAQCITATDIVITRSLAGGNGGPLQFAEVALAAVDTAGGVFAWQNPLAVPILVTRLILSVTTPSSGACTVDCGPAADGTTLNDTLIDGLSVAAGGVFDNTINHGTNGLAGAVVAANGGAADWVTGSVASGASAGIVGSAYIYYHAQ